MQAPINIKSFFDNLNNINGNVISSNSISHIIYDAFTKECAIIDSVMGYEHKTGQYITAAADMLLKFIADNKLILKWILETHIHADHITAASYIKNRYLINNDANNDVNNDVNNNVKIGISKNVNANYHQYFDVLFKHGDVISLGKHTMYILETPGHTTDSICYVCDNCAFIGDTMFAPDIGTARCDFQQGSAIQLYSSIQAILSLPKHMRIYLCHDYPFNSSINKARDMLNYVNISEQINNIHIKDKSLTEFVHLREMRDASLSGPALMHIAIAANLQAGKIDELP
jgi:glyoxylase-like metal-dependent hydrolase (beta-lactamase superfamily II)